MDLRIMLIFLTGFFVLSSAEAQLPQVVANHQEVSFRVFAPHEYVFTQLFKAYILFPDDLSPEMVRAKGVRSIGTEEGTRWYYFDRNGNCTGYAGRSSLGRDSVVCAYDRRNKIVSRTTGCFYPSGLEEIEQIKFRYKTRNRIVIKGTRFGEPFHRRIIIQRDAENRISEIRTERKLQNKFTPGIIYQFKYGSFDPESVEVDSSASSFSVFYLNEDDLLTNEAHFLVLGAGDSHTSYAYQPSATGFSIASKRTFALSPIYDRTSFYDVDGHHLSDHYNNDHTSWVETFTRNENSEERVKQDSEGNLIQKETRALDESGLWTEQTTINYMEKPPKREVILRKINYYE